MFYALIVLLCLVAPVSLLLSGFWLWLTARLLRVSIPTSTAEGAMTRVSYRRALVAVLLNGVIQIVITLAAIVFLPAYVSDSLPVALLGFVLALAIPFLLIGLILHTRPGKTFLVTLLWMVLNVGQAVVLFFVLKGTIAEAFVVPTGGMAETILGYHKLVPCRHCGHEFPVNCSKEADPQGGPPITTEEATCPNCRQPIVFRAFGLSPPIQGGDRVMVGKGILGQRRFPPDRLDVIAFYYPPRALQESRPSI
jgi:hypothetical protein